MVVAAEVVVKILSVVTVVVAETVEAITIEAVKISLPLHNGQPLVMLTSQPQSRSSASIIIRTGEELIIVLIL